MVNAELVRPLYVRLLNGVFTGKFIWGRGSSDDKSGLIGILYVSLPSRLRGANANPKTVHLLKPYSRKGLNLLAPSFSLLALTKRPAARKSAI
jgi:hypothetical protein